jgi:ComF family protein
MKRGVKIIKYFFNLIIDFLFPIECLICKKEGEFLCSSCFQKINFKHSQYCFGCKKNNLWGETCLDCQDFFIDGFLIAGDYEDPILKELILKFKYNFIKDIGKILGLFLVLFFAKIFKKEPAKNKENNIPSIFLNFESLLIIPVPLSKKRYNWRGFNQSLVLAEFFANYFSLNLNKKDLIRKIYKKPQAKLNEYERKNNLKDSFTWLGENLNGQDIILIDDVATTGSTLNECAKVLKNYGAGCIWGLVLAKG